MKKKLFALMLVSQTLLAQYPIIPLYEGNSPGLKPEAVSKKENVVKEKDGITRINDITVPTLTVIKPKKKTSDASVIVCPGGGYAILAWDHEGTSIGEWFASKGVTAFVLKYRLPQDELFENAEVRPLQDAQQSIRYIRQNAEKFGVSANKIGIMGFSAGGHLAATASTHFSNQIGEITNPQISVRPDFTILMYPVVSFSDKISHMGSRDNLIGKNPPVAKIESYSNELQVNKDTPPAFLVHAFDDWVHVDNSLNYYKALRKNGVASEMHLYDRGGHGFSMKKTNKGPVAIWPARLEEWMRLNGFMN
ncbi:alpha/beta hydrolase [Lacihabitans soyangensis]|uniref:Alpha/beta hydrolase n=1 Tax=Lacihabitans soyangensis TaxID=869394 RepID=A0AAE3KVM7_9BACT|nr:alpha/beta hydrolase [Lacihabitans soyangensis]MCP9764361.1 alpha/beta hydrolase [Lacihabitans soyangensis]